MSKKLIKFTGGLLLMVIGAIGTALYVFTHAPCSFDQNYAKQKVEKHLRASNLPLEFLAYEPNKSKECQFSYMYNGAGKKINFVVIDDFIKGPKLTYWDYKERGG